MVTESFDLTIMDPTMVKNPRKNIYQMKKNVFWIILSIIVAVFIVLFVLTIYFGVNQKRTIVNQTSIPSITTTHQPIETTTSAPPVERIPKNLKQQVYRLTISPNLTSETFTGLLNLLFKSKNSFILFKVFFYIHLNVLKQQMKSYFI
jgi:flagellar basal body-associated protein FliL